MNQTLEIIHDLRSTHGDFSDRPVSDEDVETILTAAVHAPTASARQAYSIVVVSDPEVMMAVCGYRAARMLVFCVDFTRLAAAAERLGATYHPSDLFDFVTGSSDTMLALQSAVIAAHSLEVDTLTTNGIHRGETDRVYSILGLPERYCFPLLALLLGYRARSPGPHKGRYLGPALVHRERYHRLDAGEMDAMIAEYDDRDRHLGLIDDWRKQRFKHYLEWFFKRWSPEVDTRQFYRLLVRAGFLRPERVRECEAAAEGGNGAADGSGVDGAMAAAGAAGGTDAGAQSQRK